MFAFSKPVRSIRNTLYVLENSICFAVIRSHAAVWPGFFRKSTWLQQWAWEAPAGDVLTLCSVCVLLCASFKQSADFRWNSKTFSHKIFQDWRHFISSFQPPVVRRTEQPQLVILFFEVVNANMPHWTMCNSLVSHISSPQAKVVLNWHGWRSLSLIRRYPLKMIEPQVSCMFYVAANMSSGWRWPEVLSAVWSWVWGSDGKRNGTKCLERIRQRKLL